MGRCTSTEKIYTEKVYSKFKLLHGNRWVKESKIKKIEASMIEHGWVGAPVVINSAWQVIDGQHRIKAAERAGIPVKYMFETKDVDIETVKTLNKTQTSWTEIDYIKSNADLGNNSCKNYMALYNKYVNKKGNVITNTVIMSIITGQAKHNGFKDGTYELSLEDYGKYDSKLNVLEKCAYALRVVKVPGRIDYFLSAISFMMDVGADGNKLAAKIERYSKPLNAAGNVRLALAQMEAVYNHRNKDPKYFLSDYDMMKNMEKQDKQRAKDEKRAKRG